jgi:putative ABC transport system permease protein
LLLGCFAGIALLLTIVGLYGVVAYSVTRRTREIGLRMALGAARSHVLVMVLKQALLLVLIGLVLGLGGALAGGQLLQGMLYGVKPINPLVLAAACGLIGLAGALAAYLPARRATKVDPMVALRYE